MEENKDSSLSIPLKWQEKFFIKRIEEEDILITLEQRNVILKALNDGVRFIQIGKYTLMLNSIKSIDPRYEPDNIPPEPDLKDVFERIKDGKAIMRTGVNQKEIELWNKLYRKNKLGDGTN